MVCSFSISRIKWDASIRFLVLRRQKPSTRDSSIAARKNLEEKTSLAFALAFQWWHQLGFWLSPPFLAPRLALRRPISPLVAPWPAAEVLSNDFSFLFFVSKVWFQFWSLLVFLWALLISGRNVINKLLRNHIVPILFPLFSILDSFDW